MTWELWMLLVVTATYFATVMADAAIVAKRMGAAYSLSNRDAAAARDTLSLRARRAAQNHLEGLAFFAPVVLVADAASINTQMTALGATIYAGARAAHAAVYILGVPLARSILWIVGIGGVGLIFVEIVSHG